MIFLLFVNVAFASEPTDQRILVCYKPATTEIERVELERRESLVTLAVIHLIRVRIYRLPEGASIPAVIARVSNHSFVEYAEADRVRGIQAFTDPDYPLQWALNNTGQKVNGWSGPAGVDINWPEAMVRFRAAGAIPVAVVDSGVAYLHKDLVANIFTNRIELNGVSGVDDDGNGIVDDFAGFDFLTGSPISLDQNGHGTLVASIIGGGYNNGLGGYGVCPAAAVMPLRVLDQFGKGGAPKFALASDIAVAVAYAATNGARVINLSLGGAGFTQTEQNLYASVSAMGILLVAAAGNGGADGRGDNIDFTPVYPASYAVPSMIGVAAQDRSGGLAPFSNFGIASVQVAAPGTDIRGADVTRTTILFEGFELGAVGWTVGSSAGNFSPDSWVIDLYENNRFLADHSTSLNRTYYGNTNTWAASPRIDLRSILGSRLIFDSFVSLADDILLIESSFDGVSWAIRGYLWGGNDGYASWQYDLSDLDGSQVYLRFRLVTNGSLHGGGVLIDNFKITGTLALDSNNPAFQFNNGTSFAAPIVSGVAALVMAHRPELTALQVKEILLSSSRPVPALAGKITTGAMIDAERAIVAAESAAAGIHTADINRDFAINLQELTRVIQLYNTRRGSVRTGAYGFPTGSYSEDGFTPDSARTSPGWVSHRYHVADVNRDGRISLGELTRVIELFNVRTGSARSGRYKLQPGTEDGFAGNP